MNEDNVNFAFSATFRIHDAGPWHHEIEEKTRLQPTSIHRKGDLVHPDTRFTREYKSDLWSLTSPLSEDTPFSEHLQWLYSKVSEHIDYFRELIEKGAAIDIFCGYRSDCDHAGFSIDSDALMIFHSLGISMQVSVIIHSFDP